MKLTIIISIALTLCSIQSYADENYVVNNIHSSESFSYLTTNSSSINQLLIIHDLTINSIDSLPSIELPNHISGKFKNELLSLEAGVVQFSEVSNWSKYYFQGAVTLHQYNKFNLSLMANIEQLNNFHALNFVNNNYQTSYVESLSMSNETELNYSYGLVGRYSINSTWQFSGGFIHAQAFNEPNSNAWYSNKSMALIGTTYSF